MAKSFREIGQKAEALIEQGKETDRKVQNCQARVDESNDRVVTARKQLAAASQTDENGHPQGNIEQARAQLNIAENQLAASQRALTAVLGDSERIKQQKNSHVQEIERYHQAERSNLEKLRRLRSGAFGADSAALMEGMAERFREAEDARVALLRSMGLAASPEYVSGGDGGGTDGGWRGGGFAAIGVAGQRYGLRGGAAQGAAAGNGMPASTDGARASDPTVRNPQPRDSGLLNQYGDAITRILDNPELLTKEDLQMLRDIRNQLLAEARLQDNQTEAETAKEKVKVLRLSEAELRQMGTRYIEKQLDVDRDNLINRGIAEDQDLDRFISVLHSFYIAEMEKDIAGVPNQFYEDINYDTICKLGIPAVMGMYTTLKSSAHRDVQTAYRKHANAVTVRDVHYRKGMHYRANDGVYIDISVAAKGDEFLHKPYQVALHEFAHNIDYLMGNGQPISETWGNNELYRAICRDFDTLRGNRPNEQLIHDLKIEMKTNNWSLYQIGSVSDILECMTGINYPLGAGHGSCAHRVVLPDGSVVTREESYWKNRLPNKEFFAETLDGAAANGESYQMLKRFFPSAVDVVHQMIGGIT